MTPQQINTLREEKFIEFLKNSGWDECKYGWFDTNERYPRYYPIEVLKSILESLKGYGELKEEREDYVASQVQSPASVVSLSCTDGNSIEQLEKDLLVYTVIADKEDWIRLSALYYSKKGYQYPSLEIFQDNKSDTVADNEDWISETFYNAVKRFNRREMKTGDKEILDEFVSKLPNSVYDHIEALEDVEKIIEYAKRANMLNNVLNGAVSDTTGSDSSNEAD